MEKAKQDKLLNIFKNNKEIIAVYSLSEQSSNINIYGKVDEKTFSEVQNIIHNFRKTLATDYLSFTFANFMVIYFKYDKDDVVIFGTLNLKEPVVRVGIKSLK